MAIRDQELPSLRTETERKYHDLRVETRGWAEVAIKAGNKVDRASEMVNLIYEEVRATRAELREVQTGLGEVRTGLGEVRAEQEVQGRRLDRIEAQLGEQGDVLQKILAKLS